MAGEVEFMFTPVEEVIVTITICVMIISSVCGNIALLIAIYSIPKLRTSSNFFIASLAFSNLITGSYTMPLGLVALAHHGVWIFGDNMCKLGGFIDNLTICAAMVTLGMTRYLLVCHAIKYPDIMTKKRSVICIAMIWIWSTGVSIPPLLGWSNYSFSASSYTCASELLNSYFLFYVSATFPLPILVIFPTYYCILKGSMGKVAGSNTVRKHKGNLRTAKIILLIIVIFAVCVFPVFIIGILLNAEVQIPKSQTLGFSVIWLLLANSSINPIIYGFLNKNVRNIYAIRLKRLVGVNWKLPLSSANVSQAPDRLSVSRSNVELTHVTKTAKEPDTITTSISGQNTP